MTENIDSPAAHQGKGDGAAGAPQGAPALEADIARTRADLAHTVDQLAAKLDVKSRIRASMSGTKDDATRQLRKLRDRATDEQGKPTTVTIGIGSGVVATAAVALAIALWRRNHPSRRRRRRH